MTTTLSRHAAAHQRQDSPRKCDANGNLVLDRGEWVTHATCRSGDPDALFVRGAEQRKAAAICRRCPVLMECRADALDNKVEFGVWGGLTERQRRAVLRKNPHVTDWATYLAEGGEVVGL
ncbi:WhiB family transcriptional regulator [Corynebacterium timonense]|uniref:Transcriptional regulator WhiB n=1 Tax=Corynebacterium timonense TaxID=441500 RepID=A0A1H1TLC6_9CORY|nr:WhiB family transcriptional regulator [Corynebacterium timonense]SDS61030.1 WhiB family transcriptional regulator, redox-sensing transcriptional regulator [Corynebacterium timonense]